MYSVNAGEFMPWLTFIEFKFRVEDGDNEVQACIYALVITNRKKQGSNAFRSCFWRTSLLFPT